MKYKTAGFVQKPRRFDMKWIVLAVTIIFIAISALLFYYNPAPPTTLPPSPPTAKILTCNDTCFMSGQWNRTMLTTYTDGVFSLTGSIDSFYSTNTTHFLSIQNFEANTGQNASLLHFNLQSQSSVYNVTYDLRAISVSDLDATGATYTSRCLSDSCPVTESYPGMILQFSPHFNTQDNFQIKIVTTTGTVTYVVKFS